MFNAKKILIKYEEIPIPIQFFEETPENSLKLPDFKRVGDLYRKNDYLHYYKAKDVEGNEVATQGNQSSSKAFKIDMVQHQDKFDPKTARDTTFPEHERRAAGFKCTV